MYLGLKSGAARIGARVGSSLQLRGAQVLMGTCGTVANKFSCDERKEMEGNIETKYERAEVDRRSYTCGYRVYPTIMYKIKKIRVYRVQMLAR